MGAECSCKITPSKGICTWLVKAITTYLAYRNETPKPYKWKAEGVQDAGQDPEGSRGT